MYPTVLVFLDVYYPCHSTLLSPGAVTTALGTYVTGAKTRARVFAHGAFLTRRDVFFLAEEYIFISMIIFTYFLSSHLTFAFLFLETTSLSSLCNTPSPQSTRLPRLPPPSQSTNHFLQFTTLLHPHSIFHCLFNVPSFHPAGTTSPCYLRRIVSLSHANSLFFTSFLPTFRHPYSTSIHLSSPLFTSYLSTVFFSSFILINISQESHLFRPWCARAF